jgi:hypothetical protein
MVRVTSSLFCDKDFGIGHSIFGHVHNIRSLIAILSAHVGVSSQAKMNDAPTTFAHTSHLTRSG